MVGNSRSELPTIAVRRRPGKDRPRPDTITADTTFDFCPRVMAMAHVQLRTVVRSLRNLCVAGEHGTIPDGELLAAFLSRQDQAAFAALVRRHGPMVLG